MKLNTFESKICVNGNQKNLRQNQRITSNKCKDYPAEREKLFGPWRLPIDVQIGHIHFSLKPQLACYTMDLIMILIQSVYEEIPKNQQIYIVNYTLGWRKGRLVEMDERLNQLMIDSTALFPSIRLFWNNGISYKVQVIVHDILQLKYELDMFDELYDLLGNIKEEIIKKFRLIDCYEIALQLTGQLVGVNTMKYVGNYFNPKKTNKIKLLINFKEILPISFAKQHYPNNYEDLICPITHTLMQQPIATSCKHVFDRFALCLQIYHHKLCPICRSPIMLRNLRKAVKQTNMIKKLKEINHENKMRLKKQQEQEQQKQKQLQQHFQRPNKEIQENGEEKEVIIKQQIQESVLMRQNSEYQQDVLY